MKFLFEKIFSRKMNIALLIVQSIALISLLLMSFVGFFIYLFLLFESVFFILWGVDGFILSRMMMGNINLYEDMPMTTDEKKYLRKKEMLNYKNTRYMAVMKIVMGVILFFIMFSA